MTNPLDRESLRSRVQSALEAELDHQEQVLAELDEDLLKHFVGTVSLPFEAGANNMVAVKIVDDRGIESLRIVGLD